jgi:hypothetical protein
MTGLHRALPAAARPNATRGEEHANGVTADANAFVRDRDPVAVNPGPLESDASAASATGSLSDSIAILLPDDRDRHGVDRRPVPSDQDLLPPVAILLKPISTLPEKP